MKKLVSIFVAVMMLMSLALADTAPAAETEIWYVLQLSVTVDGQVQTVNPITAGLENTLTLNPDGTGLFHNVSKGETQDIDVTYAWAGNELTIKYTVNGQEGSNVYTLDEQGHLSQTVNGTTTLYTKNRNELTDSRAYTVVNSTGETVTALSLTEAGKDAPFFEYTDGIGDGQSVTITVSYPVDHVAEYSAVLRYTTESGLSNTTEGLTFDDLTITLNLK